MADHPRSRDTVADYSRTPGEARTGINRRQWAVGAVSLVVLGAGLTRLPSVRASATPATFAEPALVQPVAPPETDAFLAFSRAITGHAELDKTTAGRMCAAMLAASTEFAAQLQKLAALADQNLEPKALLSQANIAGLRGTALSIVAAWYTGSIGTGAKSQMFAYAKALMYQPVSDGMTVPTYCNYGPVWWTAAPPAVRVSAPVEPRPVADAPTTGTPVSASNPPTAPMTTPSAAR